MGLTKARPNYAIMSLYFVRVDFYLLATTPKSPYYLIEPFLHHALSLYIADRTAVGNILVSAPSVGTKERVLHRPMLPPKRRYELFYYYAVWVSCCRIPGNIAVKTLGDLLGTHLLQIGL